MCIAICIVTKPCLGKVCIFVPILFLAKRVGRVRAGLHLNPNILFKKQLESLQSKELKSRKVTIKDLAKRNHKFEKYVDK